MNREREVDERHLLERLRLTAMTPRPARRLSTELLDLPEQPFVERITARLPVAPENQQRIVGHDAAGAFPDDVADLEAGGNRCAVG